MIDSLGNEIVERHDLSSSTPELDTTYQPALDINSTHISIISAKQKSLQHCIQFLLISIDKFLSIIAPTALQPGDFVVAYSPYVWFTGASLRTLTTMASKALPTS